MYRIVLLVSMVLSSPAYSLPNGVVEGGLGVVPGLGHIYQGETYKGLAYAGAVLSLKLGADSLTDRGVHAGRILGTAATNLWFYSIYDSYNLKVGVSENDIVKNYGSAYDFRYLVDPYILGTLVVSIPTLLWFRHKYIGKGSPAKKNLVYGKAYDDSRIATSAAFLGAHVNNSFVGLGEEALFRGFMQHTLEQEFGFLASASITSLAFGFSHYDKYQLPGSLAISAFSFSFAYLAKKNGYDLRQNIFLHAIYDTLVDTVRWSMDRESTVNFTLSMDFK